MSRNAAARPRRQTRSRTRAEHDIRLLGLPGLWPSEESAALAAAGAAARAHEQGRPVSRTRIFQVVLSPDLVAWGADIEPRLVWNGSPRDSLDFAECILMARTSVATLYFASDTPVIKENLDLLYCHAQNISGNVARSMNKNARRLSDDTDRFILIRFSILSSLILKLSKAIILDKDLTGSDLIRLIRPIPRSGLTGTTRRAAPVNKPPGDADEW